MARIFEPFFTTKEAGKDTGLGLSQVYGFAKQSGGELQVDSEVGRSSIFTLYLPRAKTKPLAVSTQPGEDAEAPILGHRRVLLVEDNLQVGEFARQMLEDLGHAASWAPDAATALRLLEEDAGRFDVVFSDVVMPGMDGVELGKEIRRRWSVKTGQGQPWDGYPYPTLLFAKNSVIAFSQAGVILESLTATNIGEISTLAQAPLATNGSACTQASTAV